MNRKNVVIIGAGIVGLATGYQLLKANPNLLVRIVEKENKIALHQTGNNSGVIHSGVYYKNGSLKARNCLLGKEELLRFCERFSIAVSKVGKVIVATCKEQLARLDEIEQRGRGNGVLLERIGRERLLEIEPYAEGMGAIWIPDCAIVNYTQVAEHIAKEFQRMGGELILGEAVVCLDRDKIATTKNVYSADFSINCAGLFSDRIAQKSLGKSRVKNQILPFRGEYYELCKTKRHLVKGLIYPVPDPRFPFLGVHLTRRVDGSVEAGPNAVLALAREGYRKRDVNWRDCFEIFSYPGFWRMAGAYWRAGLYETARSFSKRLFLKDLQKLVPSIEEKDLVPGGAGIRAQVVARDGRLVDDFSILEESNRIHVLNAPSPAATAGFSIGRSIAEKTLERMAETL